MNRNEKATMFVILVVYLLTLSIEIWAIEFADFGRLPLEVENQLFMWILGISLLCVPIPLFFVIFLGKRWPIFRSLTVSITTGLLIVVTVALALSISIVSSSHPSLAESIIEASYRAIIAFYAGWVQISVLFYGSEYGPRAQEPKDDRYYIMDDP